MVPDLGILQLEKFEGANFKYHNSIFKVLVQKYQNKMFLAPNLGIFFFSRNFTIRQFRAC